MSDTDWVEANQALLIAEFARIRARLAEEDATDAETELAALRVAMPAQSAFDVLVDAFELSPFERDVLLLCLGVEMNAAIARLCRQMSASRGATFGLAMSRFDGAHWSAIAPVGPLRRWRLIECRDTGSLASDRLSIDERILHYVVGFSYLDVRLRALIEPSMPQVLLGELQESVVDDVVARLSAEVEKPGPIQFTGDDPSAQQEVARRAARRLGFALHSLRASDLPRSPPELDVLAALWTRESVLERSALLIRTDEPDASAAAIFAERVGGLVFIASRIASDPSRGHTTFSIDRPTAGEQKRLWTLALGDHAQRLNGSLDEVSSRFRLSPDIIARTARTILANDSNPREAADLMWRSCRESTRHRLGELALRIEPVATWQDLVLPDTSLRTLRQIASHVRQRLRVFDDWGFARKSARGHGVSVLFSGESGTGKTMAAEVLANELGLELFRIDLAGMVSKYIGETEKNLRRVFDAAEDGNSILLFDEADALFGKRSDVKDSHDRYANIEVSYLLQRMECYRGLAILTTNLKSALDLAFQRRLRFSLAFPFPDPQQRECMWRRVFPESTPVAELDYRKLAQLNVAGGNIRNIALNAAFLAADAGESIGMNHLLAASRGEASKRERPFSDSETRGWA
jgi:hypothetical protein